MTNPEVTQADETMPARPQYAIGEVVIYRDNHNREQIGEVLDIRSISHCWGDQTPIVVYRVRHPSYRNHHAYVYDRDILGAAPSENAHDRR